MRLILAIASALLASALTLSTAAEAHTSNYCDHGSATGAMWKVTYQGYQNEPPQTGTGGTQARNHYHYVAHRRVSESQTDHTVKMTCGIVRNSTFDGGECSICFPSVEPGVGFAAESREVRYGFVPDLESPVLGFYSVVVATVPAGTCSIGSFIRPAEDGASGALVTEFTTPELAEALGHSCQAS